MNLGECSEANPLARSIRYLESQRTLYENQIAQLEHFGVAVKEIQMNIKRNIILIFLEKLKEQLDEGFMEVQSLELPDIMDKTRGIIIHHPLSFGKVIVEPGGRIYVSVRPTRCLNEIRYDRSVLLSF